MNKYEAALRGAGYGAAQQPRDVIAALYASILSGDLTFDEALEMAKAESLSGGQGQAQQENPLAFGLGQAGGNIATTVLPASWATKGIGAAGPALSKIAAPLGNLATKIGAGTGIAGTLGQGAVQGAVSTGLTDGDLASGALGGAAGNAVGAGLGRAIQPLRDNVGSAVRQGYTNLLQKSGIDDLTLGQMTGGKGFETVDSVLANLPFTAGTARDTAEGQLKKFTKAAAAKAGIDADLLTPQVREAAEKGFSEKYKNLIKNEVINIDDDVLADVANIAANQIDKLPTNVKPVVQSYLRDIVQSGGQLTGDAYQQARSQLSSQAKSMSSSDPFTANVLRNIRNSLDNAAERSLPDAKKGAWKEVNRQYGNYKTLQKAASRVSNDSLEGLISPSSLLSAVETANKGKSQAGYGDLYDLARAGRSVLTDTVPNSGTAQRQLVQQLLTGGGIGAGTYGLTQDPQTALAAGVGTIALPKLAQTALNSNAGKQYLTQGIPYLNKAIGNMGPTASLLGAEMASDAAQAPFDPNSDPEIQALINEYSQNPEAPQLPNGFDPESDPEIQAILQTIQMPEQTTTLPAMNAPMRVPENDILSRIQGAESGGNPNAKNPNSSASGLYQFTDPTWQGMVNNYPETGLTMADKNSPDAQQIMAELLTKENTAAYQNAGIQPNDADLYLAHFLGAPSAVKAKQSMGQNILGDALFPKAAKANQNIFYNKGKPRTIDEVYQVLGNKVGV